MKRVPRAVLALVGVLVLALTGCAGNSASVAAKVGDTTISVADVEQVGAAAAALFETGGNPIPADQVNAVAMRGLVVGALLNQTPDKGESLIPASVIAGLTQPQDTTGADEQQKARAEKYLGQMKALLALPRGADWARGWMLFGQAQTAQAPYDAMVALVKSQPVTLNPRFGTWDPNAFAGFGNPSGSLSMPMPTPTPTPTPAP